METFRIESRRVLGDSSGRIGFVFSLLPIAFKLGGFFNFLWAVLSFA